MFESFTDAAKKVMALAQEEAKKLNHEYVGTEHILLALIGNEGAETRAALGVIRRMGLCTVERIRLEVEKLVKPCQEMTAFGKLPSTPRAKKVVEYSIEEARNLESKSVGTPHILLGCLREHDGVAAQVLMNLGFKLEQVREKVLDSFPKMDDVTNEVSGEVSEEEVASRSTAESSASSPKPPFNPFEWQQREAKERLAGFLHRNRISVLPAEELQIIQIHATLALGSILNVLDQTIKTLARKLEEE